MCVGRMEGQNSFREMVETGIRSLLTGMIEEKMKGKTVKNQWLTPERIAAYYSQTMTYIIMTWIESGMEISPEELVKLFIPWFMITRSLQMYFADNGRNRSSMENIIGILFLTGADPDKMLFGRSVRDVSSVKIGYSIMIRYKNRQT